MNNKKELNRDIETRDKLIFGRYRPSKYKFGGTCHFDDLDVDNLEKLIEQNFIDLQGKHNLAPTVEEIYAFMKKYPQYTAHGYTVSADRQDYRVSLEGVEKGVPSDSVDEFKDYMELFRHADEMNVGTMYCRFE